MLFADVIHPLFSFPVIRSSCNHYKTMAKFVKETREGRRIVLKMIILTGPKDVSSLTCACAFGHVSVHIMAASFKVYGYPTSAKTRESIMINPSSVRILFLLCKRCKVCVCGKIMKASLCSFCGLG
jgi:hypothetical protein